MKFTQLYPVGFISSLDAKDGRVERKADSQLRYICGWMTEAAVPSESTFSRAFADFARHKLPGKVVESVAVGTFIADRPPSRPGEFHPEPLTEPCVTVSSHTARAIHGELPPSATV